jgi:hypothetical protein
MNLLTKILLGFLLLAAAACLWYLLTQKNRGGAGCSGSCADCTQRCGRRGDPPQGAAR